MPEPGVQAASKVVARGLHHYVYYRVAEADLAAVLPLVMAFQHSLRGDVPGLQAGLMRRPEAGAGLVTLMETYAAADPWPEGCRERIAQGPAELAGWLRGQRHVEEFVPCA